MFNVLYFNDCIFTVGEYFTLTKIQFGIIFIKVSVFYVITPAFVLNTSSEPNCIFLG